MRVSGLSSYPIKSLTGLQHESAVLKHSGILNDRRWMLVDEFGVAITAREYPQLLLLSVKIQNEGLDIFLEGRSVLSFPNQPDTKETLSISIFSSTASGLLYTQEVNNWFSEYLGIKAKLAVVNDSQIRNVREKHGGSTGDIVGFADQNPVLIISENSLNDLNEKLDQPVTMAHFRPNIVIEDCEAFEEDNWKNIKVGACEFEIVQQCMRCIFTTIDPKTAIKNTDKEPIRTLAGYRSFPKGIAFGVHAIPRKIGNIQIGDKVTLL